MIQSKLTKIIDLLITTFCSLSSCRDFPAMTWVSSKMCRSHSRRNCEVLYCQGFSLFTSHFLVWPVNLQLSLPLLRLLVPAFFRKFDGFEKV
jgi:hypothetical protein